MSDPKLVYQKYKSASIQSASREKLLLMLYEGALKFMKQASLAIEQKKLADKGVAIGRAYDIVMELANSLDHKVGGDIALNLERLYMYVTDELTKANMYNKKEHMDNCIRVMETLYSGWKEAVEKLKIEQKTELKKA